MSNNLRGVSVGILSVLFILFIIVLIFSINKNDNFKLSPDNLNQTLQLNGDCGLTLNNCQVGEFVDIDDSVTDHLWKCSGIDGGNETICNLAKNIISGPPSVPVLNRYIFSDKCSWNKTILCDNYGFNWSNVNYEEGYLWYKASTNVSGSCLNFIKSNNFAIDTNTLKENECKSSGSCFEHLDKSSCVKVCSYNQYGESCSNTVVYHPAY